MTRSPQGYRPPEVSICFFDYAAGLTRDRLLDLRLGRLNRVANLRKELQAVKDDLKTASNELCLVEWLLRQAEPKKDADKNFLLAVGVAA